MKQLSIVAALSLAFAVPTASGNGDHSIRVKLSGIEEVPVVSTVATGRFRARVSDDQITYRLSWTGLQGLVTQAHIHIAQRSVNGGIVLWLCQTAGTPAPAPVPPAVATPMCPPAPAIAGDTVEVSGTLVPASVVAIGGANVGQQISAGDWAEVLAAIRAGVAYVNVHSSLSLGGEIRAQLDDDKDKHGHHHHDRDD